MLIRRWFLIPEESDFYMLKILYLAHRVGLRKVQYCLSKERDIKHGWVKLKQNHRKIKELMDCCKYIQDSEEYNEWDKIKCDLFLEDMRQDELATTFEVLKTLEFANSNTISKLFQHKISELVENRKSAFDGKKNMITYIFLLL